ncbi:nucleotidyltransferase family protein [Rivibacter subsaxonicus]|uniref:Molybdenum cofactor cytidylyltransferase n=1 Tax=Rivibacter subsaxonicus TaxID=457575 RepID=A0A4Q7W1Y1_9BURK|nr:nucleotidyltransferase family protein [Rivibacter subsaxonicus]RZU02559.1 molybdenum cofactor cytidylyltransferase [Rivibacter subsaxonicus]
MVNREAPVVIVLAAGRSSRFNGERHKLAQSLGTSTVLGTTISNALGSGLGVVVVTTGALQPEVASHVAARDIVLLPLPGSPGAGESLGMGYSIASGVCARPNASGWLVLPGDMPMIKSSTLVQLARHLPQHPAVYAQHQGQRGHPVGFAAELYSELATLSGDEGARRLLGRYPSFGVELADPGVLLDVDTRSDLALLRELYAAP